MPTYTFRCRKCGQTTVVEHGFGQAHPENCQKVISVALELVTRRGQEKRTINRGSRICGGELVRVFDSPQVIYRGSGFYSTDRRINDDDPDDE